MIHNLIISHLSTLLVLFFTKSFSERSYSIYYYYYYLKEGGCAAYFLYIIHSLHQPLLYRSLIHPCLDYDSLLRSNSSSTFLLNGEEAQQAFRLINASHFTDSIQLLFLYHKIISLSILYRCGTEYCSSQLL